MTIAETFGEIADDIAKISPSKIVALKPSTQIQERVNELIQKKKSIGISTEESLELERYIFLDFFITLTKAKARLILTQ